MASSSLYGNKIYSKYGKNIKPKFAYPDCWNDEERMEALFAKFRTRDVNAEHYDAKMKFWQNLILKYCEHINNVIFNKNELITAFAHKKHNLLCLDEVLKEMLNIKDIRYRTEYVCVPLQTWSFWTLISYLTRPIAWGINQIRNAISLLTNGPQNNVEYVHVGLLKEFCKRFTNDILPAHAGNIYSFVNFKKKVYHSCKLSDSCLEVCLIALCADRKVGLTYTKAEERNVIQLVKVPSEFGKNVDVTTTEKSIYDLQMTEESLINQIGSLEEEIQEHDNRIQETLSQNKRGRAKILLRKKRVLQAKYSKRNAALMNIQNLLQCVEEAQNNGMVLDAYKIGSEALSEVLNSNKLEYDHVNEIVSDVQETLETHNDVQDLMDTVTNIERNKIKEEEMAKELEVIKATYHAMRKRIPKPETKDEDLTDKEVQELLDGIECAPKDAPKSKPVQLTG